MYVCVYVYICLICRCFSHLSRETLTVSGLPVVIVMVMVSLSYVDDSLLDETAARTPRRRNVQEMSKKCRRNVRDTSLRKV